MIDDMGIFRTTIGIASLNDATARLDFDDVMVDTGSEYNWLPADALRPALDAAVAAPHLIEDS